MYESWTRLRKVLPYANGRRLLFREANRFAERPEVCDPYARDRALCQAQAVGRFPAEISSPTTKTS
jgi:hypothetical protein